MRVVDGARSRWSSLILIDASIYLLEFEEFNSTSRRAFNQQQVLYDCIVGEMQRSCPGLYERYLAARLASHTTNQASAISFVPLKAPWCTAAQLKKHLLSDPTSKSREKFVGIIESLFAHTAFPNAETTLTAMFQKVVTKVAYEFKGIMQHAACRADSLTSEASSVSSMQKRVLPSRKRRAPVKCENETIPDSDSDEDNNCEPGQGCAESTAASVGSIAVGNGVPADRSPPRKLRYLTRSSTDGYRTGVATVNGTSFHCKYNVDKRTMQRIRPLLRVGMHLGQDSVLPTDLEVESAEHSQEYLFDPSLFDDHEHAQYESELDSWDFLDDWAWQQSAGPAVHLFTPLGAPRPTHPLPLPGAGLTLSGQPIVHASHSDLSEFRSIAHHTVTVLDTRAPPIPPPSVPTRSPSPVLSEGPCSPVTVDSLPRAPFHFSPFAHDSDFSRVLGVAGVAVPFPDPNAPSIHSRRVAFYRPVTPDDPFRHTDGTTNHDLHVLPLGVPESAPPLSEAAAETSSPAVSAGPHELSSTMATQPASTSKTADTHPKDEVLDTVSVISTPDAQCLRGIGRLEMH